MAPGNDPKQTRTPAGRPTGPGAMSPSPFQQPAPPAYGQPPAGAGSWQQGFPQQPVQPGLQPGFAPAQPQPGPAVADPSAAQADNALGFSAPEPSREEKYNTRYLVTSLLRQRRTTQFAIIGAVVAAVLGIMLWVWLAPKKTDEGASPKVPAVAPAAPAHGR